MSEILEKKYGGHGYTFSKESTAEVAPQGARFATTWGKDYEIDHSRSEKVLGIQYHTLEETLFDMAEVMIDAGEIPDFRPPK